MTGTQVPEARPMTRPSESLMETVMNQHREQLPDHRVQRWRSQAEQDQVRRALRRAQRASRRAQRAEQRLAAARRASVAAHDAMAQAAVQAQLAHVGS